MKAGTLLFIVRDVVNQLVDMNLLTSDGSFTKPTTQQDAQLALFIETILKKYGVDIDQHLDKVIQALPLIFSFF